MEWLSNGGGVNTQKHYLGEGGGNRRRRKAAVVALPRIGGKRCAETAGEVCVSLFGFDK